MDRRQSTFRTLFAIRLTILGCLVLGLNWLFINRWPRTTSSIESSETSYHFQELERQLDEMVKKQDVLREVVMDLKDKVASFGGSGSQRPLPSGAELRSGGGSSIGVSATQCRSAQADFYHANKDTFYGDDGKIGVMALVGRQLPRPCGSGGTDQAVPKVAVIDVGANTGQDLKYFAKWFGRARGCEHTTIYLFEPNPQVVKFRLAPKAAKVPESVVVESAVSNFTGEQTFYTNVDASSKKNEQGSLGKIHWMKGGSTFSVKTTTLDDFVRNEDISTIPVLKVDAEGWEGAVFQGAQYALTLIDFIVFECSDTIDDSRGTGHTLHDIVNTLARANFMVFKIGTRYLLRLDGEYWHPVYDKERYWSNCIAVPSRLHSFMKDVWMDRNNRSMILC